MNANLKFFNNKRTMSNFKKFLSVVLGSPKMEYLLKVNKLI